MQALSALIASIVSGEASEAVGRARRAAVVYALAGLFALCGAGFLLAAGFIAVSREIGALAAALWFGGGFILLALVLVGIHKASAGVRAKRLARQRQSEIRAVAGAAALAVLPGLLAGRARGLALLAPALAVIGYAIWRENAPRDGKDGKARD